MRPNQQNNKNRSRNRNGGRKHVNPLSRNYESTGPDVKVRGNASHVAEKYTQLARDAQSSGDSVMAENYLQHAEHYYRMVMAAQPQNARPDNSQDSDDDYEGDEADNRFASRSPERPVQQNEADNDHGGQGNDQPNPAPQPAVANAPNAGRPPRREREAVPEVKPAEAAEAAQSTEDGEAEPVRKQRRPRRRRPAGGEGTSESGGESQPEVGDLPAFITSGGATAAE